MQEILAIRDLISCEAGLHFGEARLHLLENCIRKRMGDVGLNTASEYFRFLTEGNLATQEMQELVSMAVTKETSFMRIPEHFEALREEELPKLAKQRLSKNENYLHIWSAGTSTGEEAYSLAMTALSCGIEDCIKPMIIGTDVDPGALTVARDGIYRQPRLKNVSPLTLWSHFDRTSADTFKIKDQTRKTVTFFTHNLITDHQMFDQDIIFCRNVTIYFSAENRLRVLSKLVGCLKPGGVMMLGEAEIMPREIPGIKPVGHKSSLYYVKTGGAR